jgi:hypothetical protein
MHAHGKKDEQYLQCYANMAILEVNHICECDKKIKPTTQAYIHPNSEHILHRKLLVSLIDKKDIHSVLNYSYLNKRVAP